MVSPATDCNLKEFDDQTPARGPVLPRKVFGDLLTKRELDELIAKGKMYHRKIAVRAVQATNRFVVEARGGVLAHVQPGDYLLQNAKGERTPWVIPKDAFEESFEPISEEDARRELKIVHQTK